MTFGYPKKQGRHTAPLIRLRTEDFFEQKFNFYFTTNNTRYLFPREIEAILFD